MYETDPEAKKVIDVAKGLEGLRRQDGIHAAAVVITDEPLTEYVPVQRKPDGNNPDDAPIVTQYEMHGVEDLGLLKMDFLGLRNLSVIERALDLIEVSTGDRPDIDNIPLDDPSHLRHAAQGRLDGGVPARGGPDAVAHALAGPRPPSTTWRPWSPCTGRARWRPTCTATTPTARTGARRSPTSTPTSRRSWATPTG